MNEYLRAIPDDPRRRRQHYTRQRFRINGWHDLAHRHRRRIWRAALRRLRR